MDKNREALAEQQTERTKDAERNVVGLANTRSSIRSTSEYSEQAEQEPAAWVDEDGFPWKYNLDGKDWVPLYAAPVRTKDLTDDELLNELKLLDASTARLPIGFKLFARAVIAADRKLNGVEK